MRHDLPFNEDLARRLALPLAQLYRRAHNAKNPLDRCLTAYYLWESGLKLLASTAVVVYAERDEPESSLSESLQNLARPSLGHWWEMLRRLSPVLAEAGDAHFGAVRDLVLGGSRDDLPGAAGLDAVLLEALEGASAARSTVRLSELFDRLVRYRNREVGHGAAGQRTTAFYDRLGRALFVGVPEVLGRLDVLAGRRLVYVPEVSGQADGTWLVERYELIGESPRRIASLEFVASAAKHLPRPERVYLQGAEPKGADGDAVSLIALHPLVVGDLETGEVLFLNSRRGRRRTEYVGYSSGRVMERADLLGERRTLLARVLSIPVDDAAVEGWADRSQAEEPEPPAAESAAPRRQLGEFELISELGRGGMGVVYRAWQPSLGRQVALKALFRSGDTKSEARFAREIRALGRVEHPNLVKIFTSASAGDQWFYAMELLEGTPLSAVCERLSARTTNPETLDWPTWQGTISTVCEESRQQEKPLGEGAGEPPRPPPGKRASLPARMPQGTGRGCVRHIAELVRQVAEACHALHEAGVIHRDIKPGNIIVSADGSQAVLMDLGLAQLADDTQGRLTRTRQFVGTLRYASPEQVLAVGRLDRRSDVYSLGATLWELLTLRPMFGAAEEMSTPDLMRRIQYEEPERPRRYHAGLPRDLAAIVLKCLEKDPRRRYGSALELADELRRFLDGEPVQARPIRQSERCWRWCRRNPARVAVAVFALLSVLASVALLIGGMFAAEKARSADQLQREKDQTEQARATAENYRREAERLSALLMLKNGAALCEEGDAGRGALLMARSLAMCPDAAPDLQRAIRTALSSAATTLHTLESVYNSSGPTIVAAFSPDGKTLLFGGKEAHLVDVATGQRRRVVPGVNGEISGGGFSPDGKLFVISTMRGAVRVGDASTGKDVGPAIAHPATVKSVTFSPDGKTLLVAAQFGVALQGYDVSTRQPSGPKFACTDNLYTAVYSPDGRRVATAAMERNARLWDAETGKQIGPPMIHPGVVFTVGFSPDGKTVLTGCLDGGARFWDVVSGKQTAIVLRHKGPVRSTVFSRDGRFVLTSSEDGTARMWETATGRPVGQLLSHPSELRHALFNPAHTHILTAGFEGTARLWRLAAEQGLAKILPHPGAVAVAAFSPDGKQVLTGCQESERPGESRLWDAVTGAALGPPMPQNGQVMTVAFSPNGKLALTAGNDRNVRVWRTADSSPAQPPWDYGNVVAAVAFSPDGRRVAVGGRGGRVQLRDAATGTEVASWQAYNRKGLWVWGLEFTPDGRTLLTAGGLAGLLWNVADGRLIGQAMQHSSEARTALLSPDGEIVLTCSHDRTARLWSARDGHPLCPPLVHKGEVRGGAFRPDGKVVATAAADGTVRLWEAPSGRSLAAPLFHDGWVRSVAFSPDGKRLATGCDDGTARLWSGDEGSPLGAVLQHRGPVNRVAFSPDGKTVLTASSDGTARLWTPPAPVGGGPELVALWVQVLTGMELDAEGTMQVLPGASWHQRRLRFQERGGLPRLDF